MRKATDIRRKPYVGIDIGKFLCALLILLYHYFSEHGSLPHPIDEALSLYAVAVALFMAISGFLIFDKIKDVDEGQERWKIVKRQIARILRIYTLWSIPYLFYTISEWDKATVTYVFLLKKIQGWFFKSTFYTIWFMPVLAMGLFVAFWITEKIVDWIVYILAMLLWITGSFMSTYSYFGKGLYIYDWVRSFSEAWLGGGKRMAFFCISTNFGGKVCGKNKKQYKMFKNAVDVICQYGSNADGGSDIKKYFRSYGYRYDNYDVSERFFYLRFFNKC